MKRISSRAALAMATISCLALMACGDDGDSNPDAPIVPPRMCTETSNAATLAISDQSDETFVLWSGTSPTSIGGGDTIINFEFYDVDQPLTGTIDLAAGVNANYETCAACIRVRALNAAGDAVEKTFFQDGGTITLTEDPITNKRMIGTATDVTLVEVTIDEDTFVSTPVAGGVCLSLGTITLNADAIPAAWTCPDAAFDDGTTCNCACGARDPDCDMAAAPVAGCTGTQVCSAQNTCIDVCNVLSTPPVGCPAGVCGFASATQDICVTSATAVDPAVLGGTCATATPILCAVVNTVATGLCDNFEGDDKVCREACDGADDCAVGEVCAPVIGTSPKGLCITPPLNDTCETAQLITIGTPVTGKTGGALGNYGAGLEVAACTGASQNGGDVAYQVVLTAGQMITVTVSGVSPKFDPSVAILGPGTAAAVCGVNPLNCLKGADAGLNGAMETFTFTATTAGTHFLIVDTFFRNQGGTFTLNVTSP
ncbi:MAG: hypothetical protein H0T42_26565 [Deltaproteobacteria bacterium]|nr:hypothetical protein [Deltaproteobacteria bacterium]